MPNARVSFNPVTGPSSAAVTDTDGKYVLINKSGELGAVAETHAIDISTDLEGTHKLGAEKVPPKYNTPTTLSVTVKVGDNEHNFDLTSK